MGGISTEQPYEVILGPNIVGLAQDACKYSPARVTEAITVSATNNTDTKASWANYGNCVDFFAPGVRASVGAVLGDVYTDGKLWAWRREG